MAEAYEQKKLVDQNQVVKECEAIEADIAALRAAYEQYFLGIERKPPSDDHKALKKRLQKLRGMFVRQTAGKFRIQSVEAKFTTYERLWARTLQEIENGTYVRDLKRVKRKEASRKAPGPKASDSFSIDEVEPDEIDALLSGGLEEAPGPAPVAAVPAVAPVVPQVVPAPPPKVATAAPSQPPAAARPSSPAIPAITAPLPSQSAAPTVRPSGAAQPQRGVTVPPPSARPASAPPPSASSNPALADDKLRAVYDAFVKAKRRCNEDTSALSYDQVATNLRKQVPELMRQHNAKGVEFKVVIKDGKAVLRAVPKE